MSMTQTRICFEGLKEYMDVLQEASNHLAAQGIKIVGYDYKVYSNPVTGSVTNFHGFELHYDPYKYEKASEVFTLFKNELADEDCTLEYHPQLPGAMSVLITCYA